MIFVITQFRIAPFGLQQNKPATGFDRGEMERAVVHCIVVFWIAPNLGQFVAQGFWQCVQHLAVVSQRQGKFPRQQPVFQIGYRGHVIAGLG